MPQSRAVVETQHIYSILDVTWYEGRLGELLGVEHLSVNDSTLALEGPSCCLADANHSDGSGKPIPGVRMGVPYSSSAGEVVVSSLGAFHSPNSIQVRAFLHAESVAMHLSTFLRVLWSL